MDIRVPLKASRKPRQHIIAMVKNMVGGGDEVDGDTPLMESDGPRSVFGFVTCAATATLTVAIDV